MQKVAEQWLVYRLTGSVLMLGLVGFLGQIPTFVLAPFAGVVADRHDRRKLLLVIQAFAMFQAIALSALVLSHTIQIWHIMALSFILGVVNAFDIPIRQSFTSEMVEANDGRDLGNAIAMNSSTLTVPCSHTRPRSLRPRSTSMRCSARSFSSPRSSLARARSSCSVFPLGRVPAMGRRVAMPLSRRTMVSGEDPISAI